MSRGRPTKYDQKYAEQIIEHMAQGLSAESFAGAIRVSLETLNKWTKKHKEFLEAKKIGIEVSRLKWEKIGIVAATGSKQFDKQGKLLIDGAKVQPAIWIYNMKCRWPKEWRDQDRHEDDKPDRLLAYHRTKRNIDA